MFKQFLALTLLLAFMMQTFNKALIVLDYFSNVSSYAKSCENKAKPKLHCDGKCQMMKKLKKEEKKEEQNPERKADNKNEVLFLAKNFEHPLPDFYSQTSAALYAIHHRGKATKMPRAFYHPPSA